MRQDMREDRRHANLPGQVTEFPPWIVSAYGIAVKHGFRGTEREYAISLLGRDGIEMLPMLLVTDEAEADISEEYEAIMRPSSQEYAYETEKNDFLAADQSTKVPDGLTVNGRVVRLTCGGTAFGKSAQLPASSLPAVTAADNGKILKVVSGAWAAGSAG